MTLKVNEKYEAATGDVPSPVTPEQLQEWSTLAEAAAEAPWEHVAWRHMQHDVFTAEDPDRTEGAGTIHCWHKADAAFIVSARTAVPKLIAEVMRLRKINDLSVEEITEAVFAKAVPKMDAHYREVIEKLTAEKENLHTEIARLHAGLSRGRTTEDAELAEGAVR